MSTWGDLIKAGNSWIHAVQVAGLPYIFTETEVLRSDSTAAPTLPTGYTSYAPALVIKEGQSVSCRLDRQEGMSSGDAFDLTLSFDGLAAGGTQTDDLKGELFQKADQLLTIAQNVTAATGNFNVDDTTGYSASHGYIGAERVSLSVVDGDTVNLTARGQAGSLANLYNKRSPTYSRIANKPIMYRGRDVTLWRIMTTPDGKILDSQICSTSSAYQRVIFRGFIDTPPRPCVEGMVMRCLPLVRRPGLEIGHAVEAKVYQAINEFASEAGTGDEYLPALDKLPVRIQPGAVLFGYRLETAAGTSVTNTVTVNTASSFEGVVTLGDLARSIVSGSSYLGGEILGSLQATLGTVLPAGSHGRIVVVENIPRMRIEIHSHASSPPTVPGSYFHVPQGSAAAYMMVPGQYEWKLDSLVGPGYSANVAVASVEITLTLGLDQLMGGYWLPVVQTEGSAFNDVNIPATGFALLESNQGRSVIEFDSTLDSFLYLESDTLTMIRVKAVHDFSGLINPWTGSTLKLVSGKIGSVREVMLTLLQSSGAANRGTFDTLGQGQGCSIHEDLIDLPTFNRPGLTDADVGVFSTGKSSVGDLVGGHLALRQYCLTQRLTDPDATATGATMPGDCLLAIVPASPPIVDESSVEIGVGDIVLETVSAPDAADVPNVVRVTSSTPLDSDPRTLTVQDVPRLQAEGPRATEYNAPDMSEADALQLGASLIAQGDGQMILTVRCAPWVEVQTGDPVKLTIAHPMVYDYETATRAPATVGARCLGWSTSLYDGTQTIDLLLAGSAAGTGYLCPSIDVVSKPSSTSVTVAADDLQWLTAGDTVLIYEPGEEQNSTPRAVQYTIDTISGTTVNFTGSLASWVGSDSVITYPLVANCTTRQARFTHNAAAYRLT